MGLLNFLRHRLHHDRDMRARLNGLHNQLDRLENDIEALKTQNLANTLQEKTLCCHEPGISTERYCAHNIIVSLTTFGTRIDKVHLPIESIMQGTVKPNRIILWLSEEEYTDGHIPQTLKLQQKRGLEVRFCKDYRSYTKLIPTLSQYPDDAVITVDDDALYEYDIVERLLNAHRNNLGSICACRMHRIVLDEKNTPVDYLDWNLCISDTEVTPLNFPTGVGGVLYPPHCFSNEVLNSETFMALCPKADDIWFYAMALLNGTPSLWVATSRPQGYYRPLELYPDSLSLSNTDARLKGNDTQLKKVFDHYDLYKKLLCPSHRFRTP